MNPLRILTMTFLFISVTAGNAAVLLTNFGSSTFTLDGTTSFTTTQQVSNLQITGSDLGSQLDGFFGAANITGQSDTLTLTGSATLAPASPFSVTLYDSSLATALYSGGSWTGLSGSGSTSLNFVSKSTGFDFSHVSGLELLTGGSGSTINATLTGISASASGVPEPSRTLLGMMGLLSLAIRRRRV